MLWQQYPLVLLKAIDQSIININKAYSSVAKSSGDLRKD